VRPTGGDGVGAETADPENVDDSEKEDSSTISITMGMASRRIARLRLPAVKSWCEPRRASRRSSKGAGRRRRDSSLFQ